VSEAGAFFAAALLLASAQPAQPAQSPQPSPSPPLQQNVENHDNSQGEIEKRADALIHRSSGYTFPLSLRDIPARKSQTYGPGDGGVFYTLYGGANNDAWINLYVYPAELELAAEIADVDSALTQRMGGKLTTSPPGLPRGPAGAVDKWYLGSVDKSQLLTGYRLVRHGRWYIKARISIPLGGGEAATARAMRGLAAIPWTVPVSSAASPRS
jgi:hypothetical protein